MISSLAILMLNGRPPARLLERLRPGPGAGYAALADHLPVEEGPEGEAWSQPGLLVAADGGANALWRAGLPAAMIVGDLDSLLPEARDWHLARGARLAEIPEQERNDLEKALDLLAEAGVARCWIAGFEGGRLDMLLGLMAHLAPERLPRLRLLGEEQVLIPLAPGRHRFSAGPDEPFSLLALNGACELGLAGATWGGPRLELEPGCHGVSNRARGSLEIELRHGRLLLARRAPWAGDSW